MSVISMLAIYMIFCLLVLVILLIANKIDYGIVDVETFIQAVIICFVPVLNLFFFCVSLVVISLTLFDKASKWYNGVKHNRVW